MQAKFFAEANRTRATKMMSGDWTVTVKASWMMEDDILGELKQAAVSEGRPHAQMGISDGVPFKPPHRLARLLRRPGHNRAGRIGRCGCGQWD